jgi:hypothetical protein
MISPKSSRASEQSSLDQGALQRRLAAAGFLTALTVLTRLTVLTADSIEIFDVVDGSF